MKKTVFFLTAIIFVVLSCTKEKTDYEAEAGTDVPEHYTFKEAYAFENDGYKISIEALNGAFYIGYNELRLKVMDSRTNEMAKVSSVTFLPIKTGAEGNSSSCPHTYDLVYKSDEKYFSGYSVFTGQSNAGDSWKFYISFTVSGQTHRLSPSIEVAQQPNKNLGMTSFRGKDNEEYIIALLAPQRPKVAENELVAGIYRLNQPIDSPSGTFPDPAQFSYTEVIGYTLQLDPRMPEPSMGNHSSPNNKHLTQQDDGLYHGVVNYTMTGNWTLNFMLLNQQGDVVKGSEVPKDFTPGVEGRKSELFIDVLF